jgi:DNA-binding response OmpR family regulator/class 3 adenylate cyclase
MAKIVVLEDNASTRLLISRVLEKEGHEVTAVDNGAQGLLEILAQLPDLVVSDVQMPQLTGFEVVSQMRIMEDVSHTPVILLTLLSSQEDIKAGMDFGADDYLTKPFEPLALIQSVNVQLVRAELRKKERTERSRAQDRHRLGQLQKVYNEKVFQTSQFSEIDPPSSQAPRKRIEHAWALHVTIHHQSVYQQKLGNRDWRLLQRHLYSPASPDSALKMASHVEYAGADLFLLFSDQPGQKQASDVRAVRAMADIVEASARCKRWVVGNFPQLELPAFRVLITLHCGPVYTAIMPLGNGGEREILLGSTVEQAMSLRSKNPGVLWVSTITLTAAQACDGLLRLGATQTIESGASDLQIFAVLGLGPRALELGVEEKPGVSWI